MAKRQRPSYDQGPLVQSLKASTGQGVDALFSRPSPTPQQITINTHKKEDDTQQAARTPSRPHARTDERTVSHTPGRTPDTLYMLPIVPKKRQPERYAFQFWADQITRLRKLHKLLNLLDDSDARSDITLSDLVREALDDYLHKQGKALQKRVSDQGKADVRTTGRTNVRADNRTDERPYASTREAEGV